MSQYIYKGGDGACRATHVKFMSLPLFINSSGFPKIFAFETVNKQEQKENVLLSFCGKTKYFKIPNTIPTKQNQRPNKCATKKKSTPNIE